MEQKSNEIKENIKNDCYYWQKNRGLKYLLIVLIIAIFIMCCVMLHYLGKLSDIWQAIKNMPSK